MNKALKGVMVLAAAASPLAVAGPAAAATGGDTAGSADRASVAVPSLAPVQCRNVSRTDDPPVVRGWGSVQICRSADGRRLDINGSTHDAKADGLCAQLYGQYNTGVWWYGPRACPSGNTEYFHRFKEGAVDSTVYLRFN